MLSIYIHIPFCAKKCLYCDFLSFDGNHDQMDLYIDSLIREIKMNSQQYNSISVDTIFIGGGTPSILSSLNLKKIMDSLYNYYSISEQAEITLECNPGVITKENAKLYKEIGINRISMGLQAIQDHLLKKLGRIHSYQQFLDNYKLFREVGFENINVDLMFGLPGQTLEEWEASVKGIIDLKAEHISTYGLIIENGTPFYDLYAKHYEELPSEEGEREMYHTACDMLKLAGYEHYEISNFSFKGYESRHNKVYWTLKEYIGFGLGASSFFNGQRYENIKNLDDYIQCEKISDYISETSIHMVSTQELKEEFIFLGLRLMEGISKAEYKKLFGEDIYHLYSNEIDHLQKEELIQDENGYIKLMDKGIDISNYVFGFFIR